MSNIATESLKIVGVDCTCCCNRDSNKIAYILYPMDCLADWIGEASLRYATNIVVITGMDWNNDLTPWPAPGVRKNAPDFKGHASTKSLLTSTGRQSILHYKHTGHCDSS